MINNTTHILLEILKPKVNHTFSISFKDSDAFILKELNPIDPSIYDSKGQWTAMIVEIICVSAKKEKLLKPGSGLDFKEEDIQEITDATTHELIYKM
jgi:hypothetical protein